jgi:chemotaxis protein CheD
MNKPEHVIEIFLQPGDFYFGDVNTRIRTILGSCVSITMWHPTRLIGGMCHFQLPSRAKKPGTTLDGHYADEAMQMFLQEIRGAKTHPAEYRVKVFGGGNMFINTQKENPGKPAAGRPARKFEMDVAGKNVLVARSLITSHGFRIDAEDLGGNGHRQLFFDIWNGHVWVRKPTAMDVASP